MESEERLAGRVAEISRVIDLINEGAFTAADHLIPPLVRRRSDLQQRLRELRAT